MILVLSTLVLAAVGHAGVSVCAEERHYCGCTDWVYYGVGETWDRHNNKRGKWCNNNEFGDPVYGVHKYCLCDRDGNGVDTIDVDLCATENNYCTCKNGEVWYGARSNYYHKETTHGTMCTNSVFGDPIHGVYKHCLCLKD